MNNLFRSHYIQLGLLAVIVLAVLLIMDANDTLLDRFSFLYISVGVLYLVSSLAYFLSSKGIRASGYQFVNLAMLSIVIKLLFYLIYIIAAFFLLEHQIKENLIAFLCIYFLFTVFEVVTLVLYSHQQTAK